MASCQCSACTPAHACPAPDSPRLLQIKPRWSYLLLAINVGVYAAGLVAGLGPEGTDASQDYFLALAKVDSAIESGEYYRCVHAPFNNYLCAIQPLSFLVLKLPQACKPYS